ncbi:hypothetical protein [Neobacillus massiliamazoniensis]|uniref:Uncharacterized protein n=1 Tax=Neobacillus massiliamazoniensis TaxID=1499688 RepID=A0A0U1NZ96_9BACI|nr:hypothetical protein [Neobacillus massiliamazoniensis]CRK83350.1 hypothetical protein BN000_03314 [Neobacillus massiliamazoniensis]
MEYYLMEPPIKFDNFSKLSKKETKLVFEWFISKIPERINLLKMLYELEGLNKTELDFTLESLNKVWVWFTRIINVYSQQILGRDVSKDELPNEGSFIYDYIDDPKLSVLLTAISQDIGIYLGETFIKNNHTAKWGFVTNPKNISYVNKPAISDFIFGGEKSMYDVLSAVYNLSVRYSKGEGNEEELSRSFKRWEKRLVKN